MKEIPKKKVHKYVNYIYECKCVLNGTECSIKDFVINHENLCANGNGVPCDLYDPTIERLVDHLHSSQLHVTSCKTARKQSQWVQGWIEHLSNEFTCPKGHKATMNFVNGTDQYENTIVEEIEVFCETNECEYNEVSYLVEDLF